VRLRPSLRVDHLDPAPSGAGSLLFRAAVIFALAAPPPSRAADATGSVEAGLALLAFDYAEHSLSGRTLDEERGWVPALALRAGLEAGPLFVALDGRFGRGDVRYDGQTQSANPALDALPVSTTTAATFAGVEAQAGGWLDPGRHVALLAGAAARWWDRDIQPTTVASRTGATVPVSGLHERYSWQELHAGLRAGADTGARSRLELEARFVHGLRPRIAVDWSGERVELDLGARPSWRFGLTWRFDLTAPWSLSVEGSAERFRFGESPADPVTRIREPESETTNAGLAVRVGRRF